MRLTGRVTRFIAKLMIFVWLFSGAVSVANACVVQSGWAGLPTAHPHGLADMHVAGQASAVDDEHQTTPAQRACKSFCDTAQSTVAKTGSAALDLSQAPLPAVAAAAWPMHAAPPEDDARGATPPQRRRRA